MGYHFINEVGTFASNDFENDQQQPLENDDHQIDEFQNWTYSYKKNCPKCGKQVFQMNRHLKKCTGERSDFNINQLDNQNSYPMKDEINGTKGWRKGKSKYTPYFDIDKEIGQVNISISREKKFQFHEFF